MCVFRYAHSNRTRNINIDVFMSNAFLTIGFIDKPDEQIQLPTRNDRMRKQEGKQYLPRTIEQKEKFFSRSNAKGKEILGKKDIKR